MRRMPALGSQQQMKVNRAFAARDFRTLRQVSAQARTSSVPKAVFRGPAASRSVRTIAPQIRERTVTGLKDTVATWNRGPLTGSRWTRDVIGNPIPSGTTIINRTNITNINVNFVNIVNTVGFEPANTFLFVPRTTFFAGFFGGGDGFFFFQSRHHHSLIALGFFFPFYYSDPYWNAFYCPGYYPSVYSMWGWSPGWIYPNRVYYDPYDYVYRAPVSRGYALDSAGANQAINDIETAWLDGDISALSNHLTDQVDIRIYFNGKYSYTSSTDDYYAMTADTMSTTRTASLNFSRPVWVSDREVFVSGRQVFTDPDDNEHTLYLSYRLRQLGSDWYVVAFGSSNSPIHSPYHDFRSGNSGYSGY